MPCSPHATLPLAINMAAMVSVTAGILYQKRFLQEGGLRSIATLQYVAGALVVLPLALLLERVQVKWKPVNRPDTRKIKDLEPFHLDWNLHFILAMAWSVLGLRLVSIMLPSAVARSRVPPSILKQTHFFLHYMLNCFFNHACSSDALVCEFMSGTKWGLESDRRAKE